MGILLMYEIIKLMMMNHEAFLELWEWEVKSVMKRVQHAAQQQPATGVFCVCRY